MHASIHPSIPPSVPPFLPQLLTHLTATYLSSLRCLPLFVPPTLPPFPLFPPPPPVSLAPSLRRFLFRWTLYPQSCQPSTYQLRAYMPLHVFLLHRASLTQNMLLILRASHTSTSVLFSPGPLTFSPLTPSQHALAPTHTHTAACTPLAAALVRPAPSPHGAAKLRGGGGGKDDADGGCSWHGPQDTGGGLPSGASLCGRARAFVMPQHRCDSTQAQRAGQACKMRLARLRDIHPGHPRPTAHTFVGHRPSHINWFALRVLLKSSRYA